MKVRFNCNSGANIHSKKDSGWLDTVDDLRFDEGEWEAMTEEDKYKEAELWAWENGLEIFYEEEE